MTVAILGSTGYIGQVLLRLALSHPYIDQVLPASSSSAGKEVLECDPGLSPLYAPKLEAAGGRFLDINAVVGLKPDVVFAALPHKKSAELAEPFFSTSVVIDLSADFRFSSADAYRAAYGVEAHRPDLLESAVYGLSEWYADEIRSAGLIANPGCYPTATLLPLIPLLRKNLVAGPVIVNALSGISGAGRKAKEHLLYTSRTENAAAYGPGKSHRHWNEISNQAKSLGQYPGELYFTPHLIPVHHGMEVTTSLTLSRDCADEEINAIFRQAYGNSPFVRLRSDIPETSQVRGTNRCDFTFHREERQLFLISVIDNLYKGAGGQAIQNMNIRMGVDQSIGLNLHGEI